MAGCIHWRWRRSRCRRRRRGSTGIGSSGEGTLINLKNNWANCKRRKANMTTINNEVQKPDDATLILRRTLNATPERAFRAWTSPEHIQQWMRPEPGMVVPLARIDLR